MTGLAGRAALRRARRQARVRRAVVTTAWVTVLLAVVGAATTYALYRKLSGNIVTDDVSAKLGTDRPDTPTGAGGRKPLNILLVGSDSRANGNNVLGGGKDDGQRSDTTILLHLAGDRKHATTLSIPRDTIVNLPSCVLPDGRHSPPQLNVMFNAAFQLGGSACTIRAVERLTNIRVDHHVVVDFKGFASMVDAVGGVRVCLPKPIDDERSDIHLPAGRQVVRGEQALDFVRVRHDGVQNSDLSRIRRQQAFLSSLAAKITGAGVLLNPPRLYGLLNAATNALAADPGLSSLSELMGLAQSSRGISPRNIAFVTVPVHDSSRFPNRVEATQPLADQLFESIKQDQPLARPPAKASASPGAKPPRRNLTLVPPSQVTVSVLNGTVTSGKAGAVAFALRRAGFAVGEVTNAVGRYRASVVRYGPGQQAAARTVAAAVPGAVLKPGGTGPTGIALIVGSALKPGDVHPVTRAPDPPKGSTSEPTPAPPNVPARTADADICG